MPRTQLAYQVADVSLAARSLRDQLQKLERVPTHVELLNMLARAAGFRNFQHFRADHPGDTVPAPAAPEFDAARVERAARHFNAEGQLLRWPSRDHLAQLCLWVLWSRIPPGSSFPEREVNAMLNDWHVFGDHALLRRALVDYGLMVRTVDGSRYARVSQSELPAELAPLLDKLGESA
jgi:hypothetical protein